MRTPFPTRATRGASLRYSRPESRRPFHPSKHAVAVNAPERRQKQPTALALVLVVAAANACCAEAIGIGFEAAATRMVITEGMGEAAMLGARSALGAEAALGTDMALAESVGGRAILGARGIGAVTGLGIEATELAAFRGAASELFESGSLLRVGRANVVLRNGTVLAETEVTGAQSVAVRSARSGVTVDAVRIGSRVEYRVGTRTVGYSELEHGRIQHYLRYSGTNRYAGYDIIEGSRVFQYDVNGRLVAETSLQAVSESGVGASFGMAGVTAAALHARAVRSQEDAIDREMQILVDEINRFSNSRRHQ
jgi:hypothetical protein